MEEITESYAEGDVRCPKCGKVYVSRHIVSSEKGSWTEMGCDCGMFRGPVYTSSPIVGPGIPFSRILELRESGTLEKVLREAAKPIWTREKDQT
jgi:hypothetical protein